LKPKESASLNFYYAKFVAILIVATGHYFEGSLLWIPATVCLFVFGFSSGYFTAGKSGAGFDFYDFWWAKISRLGPTLVIVSIFLAVIFLFQGRSGIWGWHSVIAIAGLSGFLDWLSIRNSSPFGSGLWFLTVLWLFYVIYPVLAILCRTKGGAWSVLSLAFLICTLGHFYASPPYALWPTVFAFIFGIFVRRVEWKPRSYVSLILAIIATLAMLVLNVYGVKQLNYYLLVLVSILVVGFLLSFNSSFLNDRKPLALAACVFEVYLIHTYLFIRVDQVAVGYVLSMVIVLVVAYVLNKVISMTSSWLGAQKLSTRNSS
jgi:peptidoglycan/LPS O-acetylase OafA/YrhL